MNIQRKLWLTKSPLTDFPFNELSIQENKNFLLSMIMMCKEENITIELNKNFERTILGGEIEIRTLLSESLFLKNRHNLIKLGIMYLEQILTLDGRYLLNWYAIGTRSFVNTNHRFFLDRIPAWYKEIRKLITIRDNTYELSNE